jgi:hypothetical protein
MSGAAASSFAVFTAPDHQDLILAAFHSPGRRRRRPARSHRMHDGAMTAAFSFRRLSARDQSAPGLHAPGQKWSFRPSKKARGAAFFS